jgi:hypothetical protein
MLIIRVIRQWTSNGFGFQNKRRGGERLGACLTYGSKPPESVSTFAEEGAPAMDTFYPERISLDRATERAVTPASPLDLFMRKARRAGPTSG